MNTQIEKENFDSVTWKDKASLWIIIAINFVCLYGIFLFIDKVYQLLIGV